MGVPFSQRKDKIMAYIQPNSVVQLFQGINLDNRYLHTIYFSGAGAQDTWFSGKVYRTYQNMSYLRYGVNQIKVKDEASELIECTYMRFQNNRTGDKWFYAFINNVEYLNENTALITYEIDVMQTWFIQGGSVRPCLVRREHVSNDTTGLHLEEEPIGSDVYECESIAYNSADGNLFTDYELVINTSEEPDVDDILNNRLVNGTKFYHLETSNPNGVHNQISALITLINGSWSSGDKPIEIIDMFTFPSKFCGTHINDNTHMITMNRPSTIGGYSPKNNKLFTYPYSYLQGTTMNGSASIYRWEYFVNINTQSAEFRCYGNPIGGGQISCYPTNYDGIVNNWDAGLIIDDFPKNPFAYDAYQAWVAAGGKVRLERAEAFTNVKGVTALISSASNAYAQGLSGVNQIGSSAINLSGTDTSIMSDLGGIAGGANRAIQGASRYINTVIDVAEAKNNIAYQWKDARYKPNVVVGTSTPNLVVARHELGFHFYNAHVKLEELKKIDDFFSMYGYATNKVKTPNLTSRANWNFVQTENCVIAGNMPATSKDAIARIFDSGITFWHNGDNVGNYTISTSNGSIDNPII